MLYALLSSSKKKKTGLSTCTAIFDQIFAEYLKQRRPFGQLCLLFCCLAQQKINFGHITSLATWFYYLLVFAVWQIRLAALKISSALTLANVFLGGKGERKSVKRGALKLPKGAQVKWLQCAFRKEQINRNNKKEQAEQEKKNKAKKTKQRNPCMFAHKSWANKAGKFRREKWEK